MMKNIFRYKSKFIVVALLFCIFTLFYFCTIVYSAFSSTMNIDGVGYSRVEADVRITDFRLASTNNSLSYYEEFSKDNVTTGVQFNGSSSISYYLEVTNYGVCDVTLYAVNGLPSGINYSIKDYNLKDKICDSTGKCNSFAIKTFEIILSSSSTYSGDLQIEFDIRPFYSISYEGFSGQYIREFISGDTVVIDLSSESKNYVTVDGEGAISYTYENGILTFSGAAGPVEIIAIDDFEPVFDYNYTGSYDTFTAPINGIYKVELWGAGGGKDGTIASSTIGKGAYTSGYIYLERDTNLYVYVGKSANYDTTSFNGGGSGEAAGGSASDVRLVSGSWDNFDSLKSRIMVAAGGGGGVLGYWDGTVPYTCTSIGDAGGLIGYDANCNVSNSGYGYSGYGASQTAGGQPGKSSSFSPYVGTETGKFGMAGYKLSYSSGGGGGYYGGGHGVHPGASWTGGGGGSSFISWHEGCDAITSTSTSTNISHTGQSKHYSNYLFSDTVMIDGRGYSWKNVVGNEKIGMPGYLDSSTMLGNSGAGHARITFIETGNYKLIKYINNGVSSYQPYILSGGDLDIALNNRYDEIEVYTSTGDRVENYSYDKSTKRLVVNDVYDDISVKFIGGGYDFSASLDGYSLLDDGIETVLSFNDVVATNFPINATFYIKRSWEDDSAYQLIHSDVITNNSDYYYSYSDVTVFDSYDLKVVLESNDGIMKTYYVTVYTECFVSGTKVLVEGGYRNIEDIKVGDYVYALDLDTNERVLKKVTRKYEGSAIETYEITVNGEKIITTPKHEFYVIDKGWIRAFDLEVGDVLNSFNNGKLEITDIKYVKHEKPVKVYNMTIEDLHNYLISSDQLLVHNSSSDMQ